MSMSGHSSVQKFEIELLICFAHEPSIAFISLIVFCLIVL